MNRCRNAPSLYRMSCPGCWGRGVRAGGVWGDGGCGGPELGRTVEAWKRVRVGSECRLESRSFHPVMWHLASGEQQPDAALGEGTLGLDGAHRRPMCRWARVQYRFVPDAAGGAARPRPAREVSAVCPAPQCGAGGLGEAGPVEKQNRYGRWTGREKQNRYSSRALTTARSVRTRGRYRSTCT